MSFAKERLLPAFIVALGLAAAGFFVGGGMVRFKRMDQSIEVRGLAERLVDSNEASLNLEFGLSSNDVGELNRKIQTAQTKLLEFLKASGLEEGELQKAPVRISDKLAQEYGGETRGDRFTARGGFLVSSGRVDVVTQLSQRTDELLKQGVVLTSSQLNYYFTDLNAIKPAMLEEATKNALEAANGFAGSMGAKVGKIRRASQGVFSLASPYSDYESNNSFKKKVRVVTQVEFLID